jgi:hypothetical protein
VDQSTAKPEPPLVPFRVHFVDGAKLEVSATSPAHAREIAEKRRSGVIDKIKRNRENGHD